MQSSSRPQSHPTSVIQLGKVVGEYVDDKPLDRPRSRGDRGGPFEIHSNSEVKPARKMVSTIPSGGDRLARRMTDARCSMGKSTRKGRSGGRNRASFLAHLPMIHRP